jgi:hypothetical protein
MEIKARGVPRRLLVRTELFLGFEGQLGSLKAVENFKLIPVSSDCGEACRKCAEGTNVAGAKKAA